jgi:PrcB C-terminal
MFAASRASLRSNIYVMKLKRSTALIFLVLLTACGAVPQGLTVVHLTSLDAAYQVFASETMLAVRDQPSWQMLWSQMTADQIPAPQLPAVDFTKDVVLVAAAGTRPSGGYSISITDATGSAGAVTVNVTITSPGSTCAVTAVVTSPVDIASVARQDGTVGFVVTRKTHNC